MTASVLTQAKSLIREGSIEAAIGRTPLLRLRRISRELAHNVEIAAKAEHLNPGGSVKDRPALAMIIHGEESGKLRPGMTILDATSGNTGIAYAMIGAARGYAVTICLPRNASRHRKEVLSGFAASIVETDPLLSTDGAQVVAREIYAREPEKYFYPDQYNNPANWLAHYQGTGLEIWEQSEKRVTHFVAGLGTSGTFVGTTRRLKELNPLIRCISIQPDSPLHGLEGLKHMATATVPGIYDSTLADRSFEVATEEAEAMVRRLAREEGLLVGASSGANLHVALQVARSAPAGSLIVTVICDGGERYID